MSTKELKMTAVGVLIGFIAGYAYYYYVGCASGSCAITSDPANSTLYGGVLGGLLFNAIFETPKKKPVD